MIRLLVLAVLLIFLNSSFSAQEDNFVLVKLDGNATLPLPASANYRRIVKNADYEDEEHLYRVCNGKNKKTCGFWENVKTKKKVPSGATTYNKNKKALIVKKVRETDFGDYMTGNKKTKVNLHKLIVKG